MGERPMCHHIDERAREFVGIAEEETEEPELEDETETDLDEPTVRTTANADD